MKIKITRWDKIIVVVLIVISFLPYLFIKAFLIGSYNQTYAYITIDGEFYKQIPLTGQIKEKRIQINTKEGSNTISIKDECIGVVEADCPDGICKTFGFISNIGETIVCLPHKLYIEIRGRQVTNDEIDIRTY